MKKLTSPLFVALVALSLAAMVAAPLNAKPGKFKTCTATAAAGKTKTVACNDCFSPIHLSVDGAVNSQGTVKCGAAAFATCTVTNNKTKKCSAKLQGIKKKKDFGSCIAVATATAGATAHCIVKDP